MENPCDICVVKVMCSEVCERKSNYTTLIKDAIKRQTILYIMHRPNLMKQYRHLLKLREENDIQIFNIKNKKINNSQ